MQNVALPAETLRALRMLSRHKVAVSWVGDKVEFRSEAAPPSGVVALLDRHEPGIVRLMRPSGDDGLSPLKRAYKRHEPRLEAVEGKRPPDVTKSQWREAMDGLEVFLLSGHADEALKLGWPEKELFGVPEMWGNVATCGAGLLIGHREVVNITSTEIRIKTASGATLAFYRKPQISYAVAYRARIKSLGADSLKEEPRLRALEAVVNLYRADHPDADVDAAKAAVLAAINQSSAKEATTP
jgi:hypothetical protein